MAGLARSTRRGRAVLDGGDAIAAVSVTLAHRYFVAAVALQGANPERFRWWSGLVVDAARMESGGRTLAQALLDLDAIAITELPARIATAWSACVERIARDESVRLAAAYARGTGGALIATAGRGEALERLPEVWADAVTHVAASASWRGELLGTHLAESAGELYAFLEPVAVSLWAELVVLVGCAGKNPRPPEFPTKALRIERALQAPMLQVAVEAARASPQLAADLLDRTCDAAAVLEPGAAVAILAGVAVVPTTASSRHIRPRPRSRGHTRRRGSRTARCDPAGGGDRSGRAGGRTSVPPIDGPGARRRRRRRFRRVDSPRPRTGRGQPRSRARSFPVGDANLAQSADRPQRRRHVRGAGRHDSPLPPHAFSPLPSRGGRPRALARSPSRRRSPRNRPVARTSGAVPNGRGQPDLSFPRRGSRCRPLGHGTFEFSRTEYRSRGLPEDGLDDSGIDDGLIAFLESFPNPLLAVGLFTLLDGIRIESRLVEELPGLRADLDRLGSAYAADSSHQAGERGAEELVEALFLIAVGKVAPEAVPARLRRHERFLREVCLALGGRSADVYDSASITARLYWTLVYANARAADVDEDFAGVIEFGGATAIDPLEHLDEAGPRTTPARGATLRCPRSSARRIPSLKSFASSSATAASKTRREDPAHT